MSASSASQTAHQDQLLESRAAYESLSSRLTDLPRRLSHPGLIPIAPRLYLPGELVRTNEILVLLGRSGEATYFAERTAWQAQEIVRRRQGVVERGLREIVAGVGDVEITERVDAPSGGLAKKRPSKLKKRVTFRDPVVCPAPPASAQPRPSAKSVVNTRTKKAALSPSPERKAMPAASARGDAWNASPKGVESFDSSQNPDVLDESSARTASDPDDGWPEEAIMPDDHSGRWTGEHVGSFDPETDSSDDDSIGKNANEHGGSANDDYAQFMDGSASERAEHAPHDANKAGNEAKPSSHIELGMAYGSPLADDAEDAEKPDTFGFGRDDDRASAIAHLPEEYLEYLRAAEMDDDSSEDEMNEFSHPANVGTSHSGPEKESQPSSAVSAEAHIVEDKVDLTSPIRPHVATNSAELVGAKRSDTDCEGPPPESSSMPSKKEAPGSATASAPENGPELERRSMREAFEKAVLNAEQRAEEDGVVNLMEIYEDESETPTRVELPPSFKPDESVDFDNDAEEYLDMTGPSAQGKSTVEPVPDDLFTTLKAEEERENREAKWKESSQRESALEKEKKEFGSGLAKGFFSAASTKKPQAPKTKVDRKQATAAADPIAVSEVVEGPVVQERVVERESSRRSSRRSRKVVSGTEPRVMSIAETLSKSQGGEDTVAGPWSCEDEENDGERGDAPASKFRQLRNLHRGAIDR